MGGEVEGEVEGDGTLRARGWVLVNLGFLEWVGSKGNVCRISF